jgi:predicted lysophospholipase L1 biosynthesis ABC-type transport system permease subunit
VRAIADDDAVAVAYDALWARAIAINGTPTPTFGTRAVKGDMKFVVLEGRAPRTAEEIAIAPTTMKRLGLHVGDEVRVGTAPVVTARVVGRVLLPESSHTSYDESAWMTADGLAHVMPAGASASGDFTEDYLLVRWKPGADEDAALARSRKLAGPHEPFESGRAALPASVAVLGELRVLPLSLAMFFALLAIATVSHALVTTVRRRRADLAILRSIGFTRRDPRVAIAWQSTLLAIGGLIAGIPLGIVAGRLTWKQLADSFPVVYSAPLEVLVVVLVVPVALLVANAVAAGPAHAATRIRPAAALRAE